MDATTQQAAVEFMAFSIVAVASAIALIVLAVAVAQWLGRMRAMKAHAAASAQVSVSASYLEVVRSRGEVYADQPMRSREVTPLSYADVEAILERKGQREDQP